ncbi:MAG: hypothetical protein ABIN61_08985 [candidate division WOR-3 bacterium]
MKKLILWVILLFGSVSLLAGPLGLGIGIHGGVELMVPEGEDSETETYPAIGGLIEFSLPGIPIGLRGDFEYSWKSFEGDVKNTTMLILLSGQYNLVLPGAPMSFYAGIGGEMAISGADLPDPLPDPENETDFGFLAYAGANYSVGIVKIFAEVGYGMIFSDPSLTHIPLRGGIKLSL